MLLSTLEKSSIKSIVSSSSLNISCILTPLILFGLFPHHHLSQTNVKNIFEDSFEVPIAERVYERVESGVDVT